jgi:hypothetical protein
MAAETQKARPVEPTQVGQRAPTVAQQPPRQIIENPPQKTVDAALASGKRQVDAAR